MESTRVFVDSPRDLLTHYIVIRRDLTFGEYSAQLAHAGEAWLLRPLPGDRTERLPINEVTAIVKGIRNEGRLLKLEKQLIAAGVPHVAIREEEGEKGGRIAGQLTVISFVPTARAQVEHFLDGIHTIEGLDVIT